MDDGPHGRATSHGKSGPCPSDLAMVMAALQVVVGTNRSQQRRCATCLRTGRRWQSVRLVPSVVPAVSVQVSHRRHTPAFSWPQWRASCLGPGFRVFNPHVKRPTSQCCSVSQYIGRKCILGSGRSTLPRRAGTHGTKQQEIAHSSCCYWRALLLRPTQSASQQKCCQA